MAASTRFCEVNFKNAEEHQNCDLVSHRRARTVERVEGQITSTHQEEIIGDDQHRCRRILRIFEMCTSKNTNIHPIIELTSRLRR